MDFDHDLVVYSFIEAALTIQQKGETMATISRDTASAVRNYCYQNLREFHGRHVAQHDVSYQTFLRFVNGERVQEETAERIVASLRELNLVDADEVPTHFDTVYTMLYQLATRSELVVSNPNHDNLVKLRDQVAAVKQFLSRYIKL